MNRGNSQHNHEVTKLESFQKDRLKCSVYTFFQIEEFKCIGPLSMTAKKKKKRSSAMCPRSLSNRDIHEYEIETMNKFFFNTVKMCGWQPSHCTSSETSLCD